MAELLTEHPITVQFPRGQVDIQITEATPAHLERFPDLKSRERGSSLVTVSLQAEAKVLGFGIPFVQLHDRQMEAWVNDNEPIVEGITLLDILESKKFTFIVPEPASSL